jgi:hypothetical protein
LGVLFSGLGLAGVLGYWSSNAVLERRVGLYWKGRVPKAIRHWAETPIALERIVAVQVCSFHVQDSDSNYTAYEINLVLTEPLGERINLMSHGKRSAIESDAATVAEFLNCPVLDHIF